MEALSIFDIYKIGVGPSSSHTLGPWKACLDFIQIIENKEFDKIEIELFGSLSKTGKGHCTDIAIQLGLSNYKPETIPTKSIAKIIKTIADTKTINILGRKIQFEAKTDIHFNNILKEEHPNTMRISIFQEKKLVYQDTYYSIGGGFILKKGEDTNTPSLAKQLPFPIIKAKDLLKHTVDYKMRISDVVMENERAFHSQKEINKGIKLLFQTMKECVYRGCTKDGILPGGLQVKRRAKGLADQLLKGEQFSNMDDFFNAIIKSDRGFNTINKWVSTFALAVNEENADLGRVVTSPTNGAAGVIPAVLLYFHLFCKTEGKRDVERFLLTSGEIGCIFKKNATISAAVGGCQAEIGVSSAMAAAGLTEVLGGTPQQVAMAAEIAMEHHLGMTCDPIGGLVQIPCIERNAMGAMKAITASNLALSGNPEDAKVDLDQAVKSMWDTAQGMNEKYKETSEGGLALNVPVIYPEC